MPADQKTRELQPPGRPPDFFIKLGGALITDKTQPYTARHETIARLAREVRQALAAAPELRLLIGHGSGSFGHWAAHPYGTRAGVTTPAQWRGYAQVAAAAARLNRIVTDAFLQANVPVLSLQPSASARCHDGALQHLDIHPIRAALSHGLTPLVYGDVALDDVRGGAIISTEDIFVYLTDHLHPAHILLLSEVEGVLAANGLVIPRITGADLPTLQETLSGSAGVDVTGGMEDKVQRMVHLAQRHPGICVHILTGTIPGLLTRVLLDTTNVPGTRIERD
ncbi:MAG TPA: isopentenyl phosphate kinase family protein [Chloroflexi bacterium]|nr:isopentenyl phosphate kinase family protein [Chloroflexota bacterium]